MRRTRFVVAAPAFAALAAFGAVATGCPAEDPCATKVLYTGGGTDEVQLTLEDAQDRATTSPDGPTITAPTAGQQIPASGDAPTFTWDSPLKTAMAAPTPWAPPRTLHGPSLFDRVAAAVIAPAYAHEAPVSSDVYLLEVPIDGAECPVKIVTTDLSVAPNADQWAELKAAAGKDLTLSITSAYLQQGRIQEGPYKAAPVTFQVK